MLKRQPTHQNVIPSRHRKLLALVRGAGTCALFSFHKVCPFYVIMNNSYLLFNKQYPMFQMNGKPISGLLLFNKHNRQILFLFFNKHANKSRDFSS